MKRALLSFLQCAAFCVALFLVLVVGTGCGGAGLAGAIEVTNAARAAGLEAHDRITTHCVAGYERAETLAAVAEVDELCIPAVKAYDLFRGTHAAAIAAIKAAQIAAADRITTAELAKLADVAARLGEAGRLLAESVNAILPEPAGKP